MQLMLAGMDAVHGALSWLFLYLIAQEDIQEKVFNEIMKTIGNQSQQSKQ